MIIIMITGLSGNVFSTAALLLIGAIVKYENKY